MKQDLAKKNEKKQGRGRLSSLVNSIIYSRAKSCTLQSLCDLESGDSHVKEVLSLIDQNGPEKN
ncbi:MAG: hypothetical protein JXK93_00760 [Sphaerochaetaceae bacterium]|nr:hypothetical protein [Sphaerochaetaceae bacterium]